ncbi:hypothetical protein ScPMuIL_015194 [Solemya velum]
MIGVALVLCVSLGTVAGGFLFGYSTPRPLFTVAPDPKEPYNLSCLIPGNHKLPLARFVDRCNSEICDATSTDCDFGLPNTYIAQHLNGKAITVDGRMDEEAWKEVPWSSSFADIRGNSYARPRFDTKVKVVWDNDRLYVGARMEETDIWANFTQDETRVYNDNAFEVFVDPDGSMANYKEMEINALRTSWDLMMTKAYMDGGDFLSNWTSDMQKGVYTDGIVNDPNHKGTFWSVEWSFRFQRLADSTRRIRPTPADNEVWFAMFARPEWPVHVVNGQYHKNPDAQAEWWAWQPTGVVSLHLPSRWGLVQFSKNLSSEFSFPKWHIYRALFDVFETLHAFKAVNGMFVTDVKQLRLKPYLLSGVCTDIPTVTLHNDEFSVTVRSRRLVGVVGHIRTDRYVWFD